MSEREDYEDKINTRLTPSDARELRSRATRLGVSVSTIMRALIRKWLKYEVRLDNGDIRDES